MHQLVASTNASISLSPSELNKYLCNIAVKLNQPCDWNSGKTIYKYALSFKRRF